VNPIITPVEPRQDAAAEAERLRELVRRAVPIVQMAIDRSNLSRLWLRDAADTIGGEA
jgi:hypothetical protein